MAGDSVNEQFLGRMNADGSHIVMLECCKPGNLQFWMVMRTFFDFRGMVMATIL